MILCLWFVIQPIWGFTVGEQSECDSVVQMSFQGIVSFFVIGLEHVLRRDFQGF